MDKINYTLSFFAMTIWGWLPSLKSASDWAGSVVPILMAVWIAVQIYFKIKNRGK
ncbi:MAG: hypothetical protein HRU28_02485 [Rhizobiales bacterium]|nr:hypothetical protein [Hyphomicrobiales bacterium]